ncbi:MAG TPA: response regulator transcription factor [Caulobacteraceae bacterium]|nr:response regulator transcription factor [Caulobacteraceae bacterium]
MTILIVDDHALVRDGLKRLLATIGQSDIAEAADGREALALARSRPFRLVILDLNLPGLGGLELLRRLFQARAGPILVLSMHAEPLYARRALEAGATGYVSKNASPDELLSAVRKLLAGGRYVEAALAQEMALTPSGAAAPLDALSPRELEVMRQLAAGRSLGEIAAAVGVGYKTIANACSAIKGKLGVTRTADLVRLAIETGVG